MSPRERLKLYRKQNSLTVIALAGKLSCSTQMVYALEAGTNSKLPGRGLGKRIHALTGIPDAAWSRIASDKPRRKTA